MNRSIRLTLVSTSIIASAMSAVFALGYSSVEMNISHSIDLELPQITKLFTTRSLWALLMPIVLLGTVLGTLRSSHAEAMALAVSAAGILFAVAWSLFCLLVWRMPYMTIGTWVE